MQKSWRWFLTSIVGANLAALLLVVAWHWPEPAAGFGGRFERNLMAWFTSVELMLAGFTALVVFVQKRTLPRAPQARDTGDPAWIWLAFALGLAYLGFDEYGEIHERIDERLAVLLGLSSRQPPLVLSAALLAGLAPAVIFLKHMRHDGVALGWFVAALALSAVAILGDHLDLPSAYDVVRRVTEDILELLAAAAFLLAFLRVMVQSWWRGHAL